MSHQMLLIIYNFFKVLMCKRRKSTFEWSSSSRCHEGFRAVYAAKELLPERLARTNAIRTKWTQPCVSVWEWLSRRTLGGGEPPKQRANERNGCYFNPSRRNILPSTFMHTEQNIQLKWLKTIKGSDSFSYNEIWHHHHHHQWLLDFNCSYKIRTSVSTHTVSQM